MRNFRRFPKGCHGRNFRKNQRGLGSGTRKNCEEKPEDWNMQQQRQNQEQNHHHSGRWCNDYDFGSNRTDWNEIETSNYSWMKGDSEYMNEFGDFNNSNWRNNNNSNTHNSNNSENDSNDIHNSSNLSDRKERFNNAVEVRMMIDGSFAASEARVEIL